jgi:hypothetical protein
LDTQTKIRNLATNFTVGGIVGTVAAPLGIISAGRFTNNPYSQQLLGNAIGNTFVDAGYQIITNGEVDLGRSTGVAITSGLGFASGEVLGNIVSKSHLGGITTSQVESFVSKFVSSKGLDSVNSPFGSIFGNAGRDFSQTIIPKAVNAGKTLFSGNVSGTIFNGTGSVLESTESLIRENQKLNPNFKIFDPGKL